MLSALRELPLPERRMARRLWPPGPSAVREPAPDRPYRTWTPAPASATPGSSLPDPLAARVRLHLKPGQKGTKQLLATYGDRLVCVRYRYDARVNRRFKTVELIIAERDWPPPRPRPAPDRIVHLRVAFAEQTIRGQVKRAGGTWDAERRLWQLRYDRVQALGLTDRIVPEEASTGGCQNVADGHLPPDAPSAST